jgi:MFS family permease
MVQYGYAAAGTDRRRHRKEVCMRLKRIPALANIMESLSILRGNTRISVLFEPMWGIPFVLYRFYLSLYMIECGITSQQIGYLISIGYLTGILFAMVGGVITDRLGRKKTTLIFDIIGWPLSMLIYFFANSFWMFALATIVNSSFWIASVSFTMMIVEDAGSRERTAAFNFLNIINIATGILVPLGGIVITALGVLKGERFFLMFAAVSMLSMMVLRNRHFTETTVGRQILAENRKVTPRELISRALPHRAALALFRRPAALAVVCVIVLYNICLTMGGITSLYFAPYITETLHLSKPNLSLLGGVYSAVLLIIFLFVNPALGRRGGIKNLIIGLLLQAAAMVLLVAIPGKNTALAMLPIIMFAIGFGIFKPFLDALLAEFTEGKDRAGMYSLVNTAVCASTALMGAVSGVLLAIDPRAIYYTSILMALLCVGALALLPRLRKAGVEA